MARADSKGLTSDPLIEREREREREREYRMSSSRFQIQQTGRRGRS